MRRVKFLILILFICSVSLCQIGWTNGNYIVSLTIDTQGNRCLIQLQNQISPYTSPSCSSSDYDYINSVFIDISTTGGKNLLSLAELAFSTGYPVNIGFSSCVSLANDQDKRKIEVLTILK